MENIHNRCSQCPTSFAKSLEAQAWSFSWKLWPRVTAARAFPGASKRTFLGFLSNVRKNCCSVSNLNIEWKLHLMQVTNGLRNCIHESNAAEEGACIAPDMTLSKSNIRLQNSSEPFALVNYCHVTGIFIRSFKFVFDVFLQKQTPDLHVQFSICAQT